MTDKFSRILAVSVIGVGAARPVLAGAEETGYPFQGHMWDGGWGYMGFGSMILFWILVVVLIVAIVRWVSASGSVAVAGGVDRSAITTLEERFARGEIDRAEFEERKNVLTP